MTLTVVHWTSRTNTGSEHVATVKNDGNNLAMDYVRTYVRTYSFKSELTATHV